MSKRKKSPKTTAGQPSVGTIATFESHASRKELSAMGKIRARSTVKTGLLGYAWRRKRAT